ncbi:hypothetical protein EYF80_065028 [Liparis tanakae]|uniref:Uncharacterized protein n=1 Tax=Liparis tanakae TaxID=230148 RepID=A0A4Z2E7D3_9TELE|nr:hypothetical protein EYF80_065028 [Liparis tanakae]
MEEESLPSGSSPLFSRLLHRLRNYLDCPSCRGARSRVAVQRPPGSRRLQRAAAAEPREAERRGPDAPWQVIKVGNHGEAEGAGSSTRSGEERRGAAEQATDHGVHVFVLSMFTRLMSVGTSLMSHACSSVSLCVT